MNGMWDQFEMMIQIIYVCVVFFDMDGIFVDLIVVVEWLWLVWVELYGIVFEMVLSVVYGCQGYQSMVIMLFECDYVINFCENEVMFVNEVFDVDGVIMILGVDGLFDVLELFFYVVVILVNVVFMIVWMWQVGLIVFVFVVIVENVFVLKLDLEGFFFVVCIFDIDLVDCVVFEDFGVGIQVVYVVGMCVIGVGLYVVVYVLIVYVDDFMYVLIVVCDEGFEFWIG